MNFTNDNIKKICNFYISDWHFTIMLLPYINKKINEENNIITILEKDMTEKVKILLEKLNLKNTNGMLQINWKKTDINKCISKLEKNIKSNKKNLVIINGTNYFIKEVNDKINREMNNKKFEKTKIKILDCYDFESNKDNMNNILKIHDGMLNTSGEIKVENVSN